MRWGDGRTTAVLAAAAIVVLAELSPRAAGVAEASSLLEDVLSEDSTDTEGSEDEIARMIEDYFSQLETAGGTAEGELVSETIENPELEMSREADGRLRYTLPNGSYYLSTVPNGMVTEQPVAITIPGNGVGVVRVDDGLPSLPEVWQFTQEGVYHVTMLFYQIPTQGVQDYNVYEVHHWFTIVGAKSGRVGAVTAPEGFSITGARLDGIPLGEVHPSCLFLEGDGRYEIFYEDTAGLGVRLRTTFERDTTAPFLSFSKDPGEGPLTPPVEFTPSEPGSRVYMSYNGNRSYAAAATLTAAGGYELEIADDAGNSRVYHLRIRQVYKLADWRVIVIALIGLGGMAARLLYLRRNMRVL